MSSIISANTRKYFTALLRGNSMQVSSMMVVASTLCPEARFTIFGLVTHFNLYRFEAGSAAGWRERLAASPNNAPRTQELVACFRSEIGSGTARGRRYQ